MLTDDMTRLSSEIHALRRTRASLIGELQHEAKVRRRAMAQICVHLGSARSALAKRSKHERVAFVHSLKRSVSAELRATRHDLAGARGAWAGQVQGK
ncbi:MAG: hypothetical protein ABSH31_18665 [Bryobacteraceae bacterium]|jgi:hypothetical protein